MHVPDDHVVGTAQKCLKLDDYLPLPLNTFRALCLEPIQSRRVAFFDRQSTFVAR